MKNVENDRVNMINVLGMFSERHLTYTPAFASLYPYSHMGSIMKKKKNPWVIKTLSGLLKKFNKNWRGSNPLYIMFLKYSAFCFNKEFEKAFDKEGLV